MTVPMWSPFAFLAVVCVVLPPPAWFRRLVVAVDWPLVAMWVTLAVFCLLFWSVVGLIVWRFA